MSKLVRNNIPSIIKASGKNCKCHRAKQSEKFNLLIDKLHEETTELGNTMTKEELLEELADLYEVLAGIIILKKIKLDDIVAAKKAKLLERGSFSKFIVLDEIEDKDSI